MRYFLGLCAVLALANPAWTSETSGISGDPQNPAPTATATAPVTTTTGNPLSPAMTTAGAYQTATAQPATPTMAAPGTYPAGTQPVATTATPMPNTTYVVNPYPTTMGGGTYYMTSPGYYYPAGTGAITYGTPGQTYTVMPGQTYYAPVQRRFGLFQRWRQQVTPTYTTSPTYGAPMYGSPVYGTQTYGAPVYTGSVYPAATYASPYYTTYSYVTPAYYTTTYASATSTDEQHDAHGRDDAEPNGRLHAHDAQRSQHVARGRHHSGDHGARRAALPEQCAASTAPAPPGAVQGTGGKTPALTTPAPPPIPRTSP